MYLNLDEYVDLTQAEVDQYIASLNRSDYIPKSLVVEKWDGQSFNGVSIDAIVSQYGYDFYTAKVDGVVCRVSFINCYEQVKSELTESALMQHVIEHFKSRLKPPREQEIAPPTEQEQLQAEVLLNQCNIIINQENQDAVLAEILLNQMGV